MLEKNEFEMPSNLSESEKSCFASAFFARQTRTRREEREAEVNRIDLSLSLSFFLFMRESDVRR